MEQIFTVQNVIIYIVVINLITFLTMYIDKKSAKKGKRRIKESTLFTLSLIGGSIGGIIGMHVLRHKTQKPAFILGFPGLLILQVLFILAVKFL